MLGRCSAARTPEWEDVLARLERAPVRERRLRWWRLAPALAADVVVAAAAVLTISAPWRGGPSVLERASAAIRAPSASQILSMHFRERRAGCCRELEGGDALVWVDGSTPRHFRALFPGAGAPFDEGGGTLAGRSVRSLYRYDRRTNTLQRLSTGSRVSVTDWDPVAIVREALADGRARVAGRATVAGKPAIRIVLSLRDRRGVPGTAVYYVHPTTYRPIEIYYPRLLELRFPFEPVFGNGIHKVRLTFLGFRYLPATPENLKLADIRALHPTARVR